MTTNGGAALHQGRRHYFMKEMMTQTAPNQLKMDLSDSGKSYGNSPILEMMLYRPFTCSSTSRSLYSSSRGPPFDSQRVKRGNPKENL